MGEAAPACISGGCEEGVEDGSGVFPVVTIVRPTIPDAAIEEDDEDELEGSDKGCLLLLSSSRQIGYIDKSGSSSGFPADRILFPLTFCRVILRLRNFLPRRNNSW